MDKSWSSGTRDLVNVFCMLTAVFDSAMLLYVCSLHRILRIDEAPGGGFKLQPSCTTHACSNAGALKVNHFEMLNSYRGGIVHRSRDKYAVTVEGTREIFKNS